MENYILKLNSGTEYKLYKGTTLVSDSDLTTLFGVAGEMYLSFDFNSGTPSDLTTFTITDSSDIAVISNSNLTDTIAEGKNYKATWSNSATTFDTFEGLEGKALDESQLSFLMGKIKDGEGFHKIVLTDDDFVNASGGTSGIRQYWTGLGSLELGITELTIQLTTNTQNVLYLCTHGYNSAAPLNAGSYFMLRSTKANYETKLYFLTTRTVFSSGGIAKTIFMVGDERNLAPSSGPGRKLSYVILHYLSSSNESQGYAWSAQYSTGLLSTSDVINNLTTSDNTFPLSAAQGKTLADRIGTLSSLTTTDKTSAVAAINEVNSNLNDVAYVGDVLSTPSSVAYVATDNIQDGAVTADKIDFTALPKFHGYLNSSMNNVSANTRIPIDTEVVNVGGFSINSNGGVVIPKTGYYRISASLGGQFNAEKGWLRVQHGANQDILSMALERSNSTTAYKILTAPTVTALLNEGEEVYLWVVDDVIGVSVAGLSKGTMIDISFV